MRYRIPACRSVAALVFQFLLASAALSFCPRFTAPANSEFFKSKFVVVGVVLTERTENDSDGFIVAWDYLVKVEKSYRGEQRAYLRIHTENDSGRFLMEKGQVYLLFVRKLEGQLVISNCGNSALISESKNAVDGIRKIARAGPYGEIEGYVEGEGRFDVSGIRMIARSGQLVFSARTDADGWFHMRVPPGKYELDAKYRHSVLLLSPYDLNEEDPQEFVVHRGGCVHIEYNAL